MTDCPNGDVRDALPDYLNDRLDATRRRAVESHLASCDECREELSLLRALRATVRRTPVVDVGAIAAAIPPYRAPVRRGWSSGWRVAAAIAAITLGGTSVVLLRGRAPVSGGAVSQPVAVAPAPTVDSAPAVTVPVPGARTPDAAAPVRAPSAPAAARELAIASGSIADLSDGELSALVEDIESLEAVPSAEVESAEPMSLPAQGGS